MLTRVLAKQARAMGLADDPVVRAQVEQASDRVLAIRRMDAFEASLKGSPLHRSGPRAL